MRAPWSTVPVLFATGCGLLAPNDRTAPMPAFWSWFTAHQASFRDPGHLDPAEYDALTAQVRTIEPDLIAELGQTPIGGSLLVISADGLQSAFPAVKATVAAAPRIPDWQVVAFRQPDAAPDWQLQLSGLTVSCADVRVQWRGTAAHADVDVWMPLPPETPTDTLGQFGFLALDQAIGEYATETQIGELRWHPTPAPVGAKTLQELRAFLGTVPASP